jgi:DNA polymerase-1
MTERKKIVAIFDGNHLSMRAFCALSNLSSHGKSTTVIYGVLEMLNSFLDEFQPEGLVVCWDFGKSEYRTKVYPEYKCRHKDVTEEDKLRKEDFYRQVGVVKCALDMLGIPQVQKFGFEGDDMICGTCDALFNTDVEKMIVSSDKDLLQLVGGRVSWLDPIKKKFVDENNFEAQIGLPKSKFLLRKCLMGDDGDDVPGVKGIGEIRALRLALKYNTLEELSNNTGITKEEQLVRGQLEILERNAELVNIECAVGLEVLRDIILILKTNRTIKGEDFALTLREYEINTMSNGIDRILETYSELLKRNERIFNELQ